eukprot:scaffold44647_cov39-Phaeocystis_antarctica.AAC.1
MRFDSSSMPGKGGRNPIFIVSADYPPLWRLVGCRRPSEKKLDLGVFWGDSELLLEEGRRKKKEEKKERRRRRKKKEERNLLR